MVNRKQNRPARPDTLPIPGTPTSATPSSKPNRVKTVGLTPAEQAAIDADIAEIARCLRNSPPRPPAQQPPPNDQATLTPLSIATDSWFTAPDDRSSANIGAVPTAPIPTLDSIPPAIPQAKTSPSSQPPRSPELPRDVTASYRSPTSTAGHPDSVPVRQNPAADTIKLPNSSKQNIAVSRHRTNGYRQVAWDGSGAIEMEHPQLGRVRIALDGTVQNTAPQDSPKPSPQDTISWQDRLGSTSNAITKHLDQARNTIQSWPGWRTAKKAAMTAGAVGMLITLSTFNTTSDTDQQPEQPTISRSTATPKPAVKQSPQPTPQTPQTQEITLDFTDTVQINSLNGLYNMLGCKNAKDRIAFTRAFQRLDEAGKTKSGLLPYEYLAQKITNGITQSQLADMQAIAADIQDGQYDGDNQDGQQIINQANKQAGSIHKAMQAKQKKQTQKSVKPGLLQRAKDAAATAGKKVKKGWRSLWS